MRKLRNEPKASDSGSRAPFSDRLRNLRNRFSHRIPLNPCEKLRNEPKASVSGSRALFQVNLRNWSKQTSPERIAALKSVTVKESTRSMHKREEPKCRPNSSPNRGIIGVVLTGMLDDGTAGLIAIQKCGGVTVVQDPKDAAYPEMPQSVLNNLQVDYCVPLAGMGTLLEQLVHAPHDKSAPVPEGHPDRGGDRGTGFKRYRAG
jgi:hypothetical protein